MYASVCSLTCISLYNVTFNRIDCEPDWVNHTLRNVFSLLLNATWRKTKQCFFFLCANVGQIVSTMTDIQLTFYHTCRLWNIRNSWPSDSSELHGSSMSTDTYQVCDCFIWLGLRKLTRRCQKQRNSETVSCLFWILTEGLDHDWICHAVAKKLLLIMCYEWYDKMLPFLSLTNGKSFILPQTGHLYIFHHFT